jgi:DNA replication and repair protein RecF
MFPDAGALSLTLSSGVGVEAEDDFAAAFGERLRERLRRDRARGSTSVGPHRADLFLALGDRETRAYASQGQQRAIVLALKLAEVCLLTVRLGAPPILLLDDVGSELDRERTGALFAALSQSGSQVWLSSTGTSPLPIDEQMQIVEVVSGQLR